MKTTEKTMTMNVINALHVNPNSLNACLADATTRPIAVSLICTVLNLIAFANARKGKIRRKKCVRDAENGKPAPIRGPEEARSLSPTLIPTVLPIVYKISGTNRFEVLEALDLSRKNEVWGWQLKSGIFMKKTAQSGESAAYNHPYAGYIAEHLEFNGSKGRLPSWKNFMATMKDHGASERISATAAVLRNYGIDADRELDCRCWCLEKVEHNPAHFFRFDGTDGKLKIEACYENACLSHERIAVVFD